MDLLSGICKSSQALIFVLLMKVIENFKYEIILFGELSIFDSIPINVS